jgi:L-alanine-DL-glutamate epimerase-like enolase superfamily enzyme
MPKDVATPGGEHRRFRARGLREALRMVATARAHEMLVMAGCMIESSLGITAAAHFAPLLDCADYDGAALVANDPYLGATVERGRIEMPDGPGLGVARRV